MRYTPQKIRNFVRTGWGYAPLLGRLKTPEELPPLVIMSMPRSGSSWVGRIMGSSRNAAYMREPFTFRRKASGAPGTMFKLQEDGSDYPIYRQAINRAMTGVPAFPHSVLSYPKQWALRNAHRKRVVIKEVNPMALGYLHRHYAFDAVFVFRHPLAIVESFSRLGWWNRENPKACMNWLSMCWLEADRVLSQGKHLYLKYEDLCLQPEQSFRDALHWASLSFDDDVKAALAASIGQGDRSDTYSTVRDPLSMAYAWRENFSQAESDRFFEAYSAFPNRFYTDRSEWRVSEHPAADDSRP